MYSLIGSVSIGTEFEILENSLPFSNSYLTLAHEVIKIPVGGGVGWNNWIRKRAPVSACMQIGGQFGAYIRKEEGGAPGRDEPKSRGKFYRIFKTCFDLQMPASCHRERNSECKEGRRGLFRYGIAAWKKDAAPVETRTRRKSLHFIAGLKGLQSNA